MNFIGVGLYLEVNAIRKVWVPWIIAAWLPTWELQPLLGSVCMCVGLQPHCELFGTNGTTEDQTLSPLFASCRPALAVPFARTRILYDKYTLLHCVRLLLLVLLVLLLPYWCYWYFWCSWSTARPARPSSGLYNVLRGNREAVISLGIRKLSFCSVPLLLP